MKTQMAILCVGWMLYALVSPAAAENYEGLRVKDVRIDCLAAPELQKHILGKLTIRSGDTFSQEQVRKSIREIYALNWFSQVTVSAELVDGEVRLSFCPDQFRTISKIEINGNRLMFRETLAAALGIRVGELITSAKFEGIKQNIIAFYKDHGYYEANVSIWTEEEPKSDKVILHVETEEGRPATIGKISFEGASALSQKTLLKTLKLQSGKRLLQDGLEKAKNRLTQEYIRRGYFEGMITIDSVNYDAKTAQLDVLVRIREGARTDVRFEGNRRVKEAALRKLVKMTEFIEANKEVLKKITEKFLAYYYQQGFPFAQIRYEYTRENEQPVVTFFIEEGAQPFVTQVTFEGNRAFRGKELSKQLFTQPKGWFQKGRYQDAVFKEDLLALQAFYQHHGYLQAKVTGAPTFSADNKAVSCHIVIDEGKQTRIERLTLEGEPDERIAKEIRESLLFKENDPLDPNFISKNIAQIKDIYSNYGYMKADAEFIPAFSDDQERVALTLKLARGQQFRVGAITILGTVRTKKAFVTRELQIHEGDVYSREKVKETIRRLLQLGIYDSASFRFLDTKSHDPVQPMLLEVAETSAKKVGFGIGYSSVDDAKGFVEYADKNLLNYGGKAAARLELSVNRPRLTLNYLQPHLLSASTSLSTTIFDDFRKDNDNFEVEQRGGRIAINYDIRESLSLSGGFFFERNDPVNVKMDAILSDSDLYVRNIAGLRLSASWDTRDDLLLPTKGGSTQLTSRFALDALGSEFDFFEVGAKQSWFFPVMKNVVLACSMDGEMIEPIQSSDVIPIYYRYFLGGDVSQAAPVRGFEKNEIGPKQGEFHVNVGGDRLFALNAELRFRLFGPIGGVLFYDGGANWLNSKGFEWSDYRDGAGAGLRLATPIGPLRFDYGWKIDRQLGETAGEYYLTIGSAF